LAEIQSTYIESMNDEELDLNSLFRLFFYAKVKTNDSYLGLLPLISKNMLLFPNGEFEGIWSTEKFKFAWYTAPQRIDEWVRVWVIGPIALGR